MADHSRPAARGGTRPGAGLVDAHGRGRVLHLSGLDIVSKFGHRAIFPDGVTARRAPRLYVSRHYKLRNLEQARRKVERIRPNGKEPNLHTHYARCTDDRDFYVSAARLHRYDFDHRWRFDSVFDGRRGQAITTRLPDGAAVEATARRDAG